MSTPEAGPFSVRSRSRPARSALRRGARSWTRSRSRRSKPGPITPVLKSCWPKTGTEFHRGWEDARAAPRWAARVLPSPWVNHGQLESWLLFHNFLTDIGRLFIFRKTTLLEE